MMMMMMMMLLLSFFVLRNHFSYFLKFLCDCWCCGFVVLLQGKSSVRVSANATPASVHGWFISPPRQTSSSSSSSLGATTTTTTTTKPSPPPPPPRMATALADIRNLDMSRVVSLSEPCILHFPVCGWFWFKSKYHILGDFASEWTNPSSGGGGGGGGSSSNRRRIINGKQQQGIDRSNRMDLKNDQKRDSSSSSSSSSSRKDIQKRKSQLLQQKNDVVVTSSSSPSTATTIASSSTITVNKPRSSGKTLCQHSRIGHQSDHEKEDGDNNDDDDYGDDDGNSNDIGIDPHPEEKPLKVRIQPSFHLDARDAWIRNKEKGLQKLFRSQVLLINNTKEVERQVESGVCMRLTINFNGKKKCFKSVANIRNKNGGNKVDKVFDATKDHVNVVSSSVELERGTQHLFKASPITHVSTSREESSDCKKEREINSRNLDKAWLLSHIAKKFLAPK